mmetsp:Transcript_47501/g.97095  ORF Transcript_47501/g.97095 Transcript_47501/m.97095 type:complete len:433 (+) Transcript_47501:1-1299(+)
MEATYTDAEAKCAGEGGGAHLPVVVSKEENEFIHTESGGDTWLGMMREDDNTDNIEDFIWITGERVEKVGGVNDDISRRSNELCMRIDTPDRWKDARCTSRFDVVCERELFPTCNDKILNQGEERVDCGGPCPACLITCSEAEGWQELGMSCFKKVAAANFDDAVSACANEGAHLPIVSSEEEHDLLFAMAGRVWLGMETEFWFPRSIEDYTWVDGETAASVAGVEVEMQGLGRCIRIYAVREWSSAVCSSMSSVVCERERNPRCDDGLQNQDEQGVDCGGMLCAPCSTDAGAALATEATSPELAAASSTGSAKEESGTPGPLFFTLLSAAAAVTLAVSIGYLVFKYSRACAPHPYHATEVMCISMKEAADSGLVYYTGEGGRFTRTPSLGTCPIEPGVSPFFMDEQEGVGMEGMEGVAVLGINHDCGDTRE